jgi:F0F1-type ATP synthase membrane subunit c/vacuolar-type H+-ATPase subunit K
VAPPPSQSVEPSFRTSRIVHAALVGSLLVYAVLVHVLRATKPSQPMLDEPVLEGVRVAVYFLGGALALGVLLLRWRWLTVEAAAPPVTQLQARLIICLALAEAIGILGLLLALMGGSLQDFYVFWVPAVGLQLLLTPTRPVWEAAARSRRRRSR